MSIYRLAPSLLAVMVASPPVLPRDERRAGAAERIVAGSGEASNSGIVWRRERRRVIKGKR
jgi:hypothetical protein